MQPARIISEQRDVAYLPTPNMVSMVLCEQMPPEALVTSALGLVFSAQGFLMTNLRRRGWDIPGGHVEQGESPAAAMCREVREETGVEVRPVSLLGYQHVHIEGPVPHGYRYPVPDSYQLLYMATVLRDLGLKVSEETSEARFWPIEEVRALGWVMANKPLFEAALARWRNVQQRRPSDLFGIG